MSEAPVVVVGAGIGGLACAIELASRGMPVTVLEQAAQAGGKMRELALGERRIDAGPTVFTMRWVFDELFERAGARLADHLSLLPVDTLARHAWRDGASLDLFSDIDRSAEQIARLAGAAQALRYRDFCERARRICQALEHPFLRAPRPNPLSLMVRGGWRGLPGMLRISPFATLWSALGEHFPDERLRQLFGRYATYCGSSPFLAPATLMLVAHVEREGVWQVDGGMQRVAQALVRLAGTLGVQLRCGVPVDEILQRAGRVCGVRLHGGETLPASAVVFNGDAAALHAGLLGAAACAAAPAPGGQRSLSAITWALNTRVEGLALARHNVFFGDDSRREFDDLFVRAQVPTDPTVYVCAQDRDEPAGDAGAQRLLCLVNAPATGDTAPLSDKELMRCEQRMLQRLAQCGLRLAPPQAPPVCTTPADFARMFPATGGALYGRASHGWMASFRRPGSRTRLPGLYLAGGSTHPGPGVPMAALSGHLAATSLQADRAADRSSTARWPRAATPGGTSMR